MGSAERLAQIEARLRAANREADNPYAGTAARCALFEGCWEDLPFLLELVQRLRAERDEWEERCRDCGVAPCESPGCCEPAEHGVRYCEQHELDAIERGVPMDEIVWPIPGGRP